MRALRFYSKGDLRLEDAPSPQCLPNEVRLHVAYCGICGTDLHEYTDGPILLPAKGSRNAYTGAELPLTMGHEMSGVIAEVGSDVANLSVGQHVAVNPAMDDRHHGHEPCELCVSGRHNICKRSTFYGLQAPNGGFADEICVDSVAVVPLPENVSLRLAALAEPLSVASHMIRLSGFCEGQTAVIFGAGPIGCSLTLLLKEFGAGFVLVSEVLESRGAEARACGADRVVNPLLSTNATSTAVIEQLEIGADIAFDACGLQSTFDEAFRCTKPGGVVFNVAIHDKPLALNLNLLTLPEKRLLAGNAYTTEDFERVMGVLSKRGSDLERFISATVPLEKAVEGGFEELIHKKAQHNKILVEVNGSLERG